MQSIDQLIQAKWLIPCENDNEILKNHCLAISKGQIIDILPAEDAQKKYEAREVKHYPSHAIMPGFINSHTHTAMNVFRGLADDLELMDWLQNYIWPAETKFVSDELVYDASLLAIAEMIKSGTTCFNDMYFFIDATARAANDAGVRAGIGMTIINVPTAWAKTTDEYFKRSLEFLETYRNHDFIKPTIAPHSTYTLSHSDLEKVKTFRDEYQLKTNIHLQEAPSEMAYAKEHLKKRPLNLLDEIGLLDKDLIAIHMTQVNDEDFELLKKRQPSIVHCPESNLKLVCGLSPVDAFLKAGINVALGTDGAASNNDLDMISEMRTAAFIGKLKADDPKALPAHQVLQMATLNGAKALGLSDITGSLKIGKSADFIAIHLGEVETQPVYHAISQIVYAGSRHLVTDVWVHGKQLMKNRELLTLDEKELLQKAQSWGKKIETSI